MPTPRDVPKHLHDRLKTPRALTSKEKRARIEEISRRSAALPVLEKRSEDDILGYDETGLPRPSR